MTSVHDAKAGTEHGTMSAKNSCDDAGRSPLDALLAMGCLAFAPFPELSSACFLAFIERAQDGRLRDAAREVLFALFAQSGSVPRWRLFDLRRHEDRHVRCAALFGLALQDLGSGCCDEARIALRCFLEEAPDGWHANEAELLLALADEEAGDEESCFLRCRTVVGASCRGRVRLIAAKKALQHCGDRSPGEVEGICAVVVELGSDRDRISILRDYAVPWFADPRCRYYSLGLVGAVAGCGGGETVRRAVSVVLRGFADVLQRGRE